MEIIVICLLKTIYYESTVSFLCLAVWTVFNGLTFSLKAGDRKVVANKFPHQPNDSSWFIFMQAIILVGRKMRGGEKKENLLTYYKVSYSPARLMP